LDGQTYSGVLLVRSFARIHETNLKKQGILPLTFADAADYEKVREDDKLSIVDIKGLSEGRPVTVRLDHTDGTNEDFPALHTLSREQITWFWAGSALNLLRK
jgi:aconitate hydratase